MSDTDEAPENGTGATDELALQRQRRRRLLKGLVTAGAGVPVVLTLSSGAALAASSTTCFAAMNKVDEEDIGGALYRCIPNTHPTSETWVRAYRNTSSPTFGDSGNTMSVYGGTPAADDRCLLYFTPHGQAGQGTPQYGSATTFGMDNTNVLITISCWNSFTNT